MHQNIKKLFNTGLFDIKPGLKRIAKVLKFLDNPQDRIRYVLIAGTNGKGSVASILSSILTSNGYKTGLYTSPHLISVTERIKIDNEEISEESLNEALGLVFDACDKTGIKLSFFELITVSAFIYFEQKKIDVGVLEVGMGGRWDATNVITPLVSVITNISLDHTEHLGETIDLIAKEKAEIIKENIPVVCGVTGSELDLFIKKTMETKSDFYVFNKDFSFKRTDDGKFNYSGMDYNIKGLTTNLAGNHQIVNSVLALAVSEVLKRDSKIDIDLTKINGPLNSVQKNGRFEIVNVNPSVILDCAHNVGSADALVETLDQFCSRQKFVFLISMLSGKDHQGFVSTISVKARKFVITKIPNERGVETEQLLNTSKSYVEDSVIIDDYKEAFEYVKSLNKPVCVTGSIYLIGLIKEYLKN